MLEVAGISKRFGGLAVLSDIGFAVPAGVILGLIGPNGAGKTTLFNILSGFVAGDTGTVRLQGRDVTALAPEQRARLGLARTFQLVKPFDRLSVLENVMIGAFAADRSRALAARRATEALDRVGLSEWRDERPGALTLANRKRMELARCIAMAPQLLLLDEVMCGLNPTEFAAMIELIRSIRDERVTILFVEHIMEAIAELADDILVLAAGRILARGAPQTVLRDPAVIAAYLGESEIYAEG
jgi:ABC-type branched-subunit amino acid transport system ATPase component